jgi:hypothetical protein
MLDYDHWLKQYQENPIIKEGYTPVVFYKEIPIAWKPIGQKPTCLESFDNYNRHTYPISSQRIFRNQK